MAAPDTKVRVGLMITAAAEGGFTVSDPMQTPMGGVQNLLFAGSLGESLRYIARAMAPEVEVSATAGAPPGASEPPTLTAFLNALCDVYSRTAGRRGIAEVKMTEPEMLNILRHFGRLSGDA